MSQSHKMGTALVRYLDTPRLFLNVYEQPKRESLPKIKGELFLSQKIANAALDANNGYAKRVGTVVRGS